MKLTVSFPDMQLSIEIEGPNAIDLIDIAVKALLKLRKMVLNAKEENKGNRKEKGVISKN